MSNEVTQKINIVITYNTESENLTFNIDCDPAINKERVAKGDMVQSIGAHVVSKVVEAVSDVQESME